MWNLASCVGHFKYVALAVSVSLLSGCAYSYRPIDYPDPSVQETIAQGISNSGAIVGYYRTRKDPFNRHAFLRDPGGHFTQIDFPNSSDTRAFKITPGGGGQIVGVTTTHGFIRDGSTTDPIDFIKKPPTPAPLPTYAYGINSFGEVVGVYFDNVGRHGFLDEANDFRTLDIPGQQETNVTAISDKMAITGFVYDGQTRAFTGDLQGNYIFFNVPNTNSTEAWGINSNGDVVGFSDRGINDSFMRNAAGVLTAIKVPQGSLTQAYGINDQGEIV